MIRKLDKSLLTIAVLFPAATIVMGAEAQLTHHVRNVVASGEAKYVGRLSPTQSMRIVLVLPLRNQADLDALLRDLYNPFSVNYRNFLTVEEFTVMFGPKQEDYDAAVSYARTKGLTVVGTSRNRVNLDVEGKVPEIEAAVHVHMNIYQHPTENRTFFAPDREPSTDLPFALWHVAGLDNYSLARPQLTARPESARPAATTGSCPSASFCGSDMRAAYYGTGKLTGKGQSLGLLEFAGTDLTDLNAYYTNAHQTNNVPITLLSTDGTSTSCVYPSCDDTEQTIDMTQALGMAPGLSSLVMYIGSTDSAIFNAMATANPLNAQLSSSWSWKPVDPSTDDPYFVEFAVQGQNLFQASGAGKWTTGQDIWPADDQYVTCVGGTGLTTAGARGPWAFETAGYGGGGISIDDIAIPFWQVKTAEGCTDCSKTLRNGPDVSANASYTFYVCADQQPCTANLYGGTSFSTPMWAGYLALANEEAVANGKTIGFINPTLYNVGLGPHYDKAFHDITSGSNGYPATVGYDLASGWGSPNGATLAAILARTLK
jgi:kumamolisin